MRAVPSAQSLVIAEVEPSATPDAPTDWRHRGVTAVDEALAIEVDGNTDLADTTPMLVATLANQRNVEKHLLIAVAEADAEVVLGRAWVRVARRDNQHIAWWRSVSCPLHGAAASARRCGSAHVIRREP